eukprot:TRINITY_DN81114_c0_g1_i1.p1 TRINITY_DN81114_c0_g1~~TRINITY_DN81114_c0_g1_i1.p1  ORF type:complete len:303 (-),score=42.33 TRINITY_DN81114_c0_g1_i1:137-1045(-)
MLLRLREEVQLKLLDFAKEGLHVHDAGKFPWWGWLILVLLFAVAAALVGQKHEEEEDKKPRHVVEGTTSTALFEQVDSARVRSLTDAMKSPRSRAQSMASNQGGSMTAFQPSTLPPTAVPPTALPPTPIPSQTLPPTAVPSVPPIPIPSTTIPGSRAMMVPSQPEAAKVPSSQGQPVQMPGGWLQATPPGTLPPQAVQAGVGSPGGSMSPTRSPIVRTSSGLTPSAAAFAAAPRSQTVHNLSPVMNPVGPPITSLQPPGSMSNVQVRGAPAYGTWPNVPTAAAPPGSRTLAGAAGVVVSTQR